MKKLVMTILAIVAIATAAMAQDNALYVYRNDGSFNAFYDAEIDSMTYSNIDTAGVEHEKFVTQVVYTPDSTYRIPLTAIDSVAFAPLPTVYKLGVIKLTDKYIPYIVTVDSMSITFKSETPTNLKPRKGDILLYEGFSDLFPNGFVGKVTGTSSGSGYKVDCDSVDIEDVYSQLTMIGNYELQGDSTAGSPVCYRLKKVQPKASGESGLNVKFNINLASDDVGSLGLSYSGSLRVKAVLIMGKGRPFNLTLERTTSHTFVGTAKISAKGRFFLNGEKKVKFLDLNLPLPNCPLIKLEYVLAPFLRGEIEGSLSASLSYGVTMKNTTIFSKDKSPVSYKSTSSSGKFPTFDAAFNVKGYVFGGIIASTYFGSVGNFAGLEANLYAGPKLEGNLHVDLVNLAKKDWYDAIKDSYAKTSVSIELESKATIDLLTFKKSKVFADISVDLWANKWYLYPEFSAPKYVRGKNATMATLTTSVTRTLPTDAEVGLGLYDTGGNLLETVWSPATYRKEDNFSNPYQCAFSGLSTGKDYVCHPMVKAYGMEMMASPSTTFTLSEDTTVTTGVATTITQTGAVIGGSVKGAANARSTVSIGVIYGTSSALSATSGTRVASGRTSDGDFSVTLSGLTKKTTYYYCAYMALDGNYYYGDVSSFTTKDDEITPGEAIDLGLSVKWASHNVGATTPEGYGGYYAWGETETKSDYTWDTYKYYNSSTGNCTNIGSSISGTSYDVARAKWGGSWRMPTHAEQVELNDKCTWTWITYNGVAGMKVTGPNGNSIFLPAAGYRLGTDVYVAGTDGYYWSGTLDESYSDSAYGMYFDSGGYLDWYYDWIRYVGLPVRPVE